MELRQKGLKNANVKTVMFVFIVKLGSRWQPLLLATRPNQPPSHGASSWIHGSHHSSHSKFPAVVIYSLYVIHWILIHLRLLKQKCWDLDLILILFKDLIE